jgi:hypothetical protein
MRHCLRFAAPVGLALCLATPVLAQKAEATPQDWTLDVTPEQKAVIASVDFSNGVTVLARCMDGVYDVLIRGLPDANRGVMARELGIQMGDEAEPETSIWTVGQQRSAAFSRVPAIVARKLAEGGRLQIIVPATRETPKTRYVMELNPSSTAIEQTLTACGRPMVDLRMARSDDIEGNGQDGLPTAINWQTAPRPTFPAPVSGLTPLRGYAVLSCVATEDGRLDDCQIESEQPAGFNLARNVIRSLSRARVKLTEEEAASGRPLAGRVIIFSVNFITRR